MVLESERGYFKVPGVVLVWCGVVWCGEEREDLSSAGEKRRQKRRAIALKPNCQNLSYPYVSQKQCNGVSYHCRAD